MRRQYVRLFASGKLREELRKRKEVRAEEKELGSPPTLHHLRRHAENYGPRWYQSDNIPKIAKKVM